VFYAPPSDFFYGNPNTISKFMKIRRESRGGLPSGSVNLANFANLEIFASKLCYSSPLIKTEQAGLLAIFPEARLFLTEFKVAFANLQYFDPGLESG
jgi:hypothetical protein